MSVRYMHPQVSWGHLVYHMGNFGSIFHPSKGIPSMQIPMHSYMVHMGGSYYLTSQGHGIYNNPPYKSQSFEGHVIKCCTLCSLFYSHWIFRIYLDSQTYLCAIIWHGLWSPPRFLVTFHSLKVRRERILVITLWLFISSSLWINWTIITFDWDYFIVPLRV